MKSILRAGIIGCGAIASTLDDDVADVPGYVLRPYSHGALYRRHPRTELVAAAEIDPERLAAFGERWGVSALYRDYREMLAKERLDIVSIATTTSTHAEITIAAARSGLKGIFLEKPVAGSLREADDMVRACESNGVQVVVNHFRTFEPYYRAARTLIRSGEIGRVHGVLATWGGGLSEGGSHLYDLLRYMLGSTVSRVFCDLDAGTPSLDPGGDLYLVFSAGERAHVHMPLDSSTAKPGDVEFVGTRGAIRMGGYVARWWKYVTEHGMTVPIEWPFPGRHDGHSGMYTALDELIAAIEDGRPVASSLQDGRSALEVTVALLKSAAIGLPIQLPVSDLDHPVRSAR